MPYIDQAAKDYNATAHPRNCGELNYRLTLLLIEYTKADCLDWYKFRIDLDYLFMMYVEVEELRYQRLNDIGGAVVNAGIEYCRRLREFKRDPNYDLLDEMAAVYEQFYQKVAVPYEKRKIIENGDVYPETF